MHCGKLLLAVALLLCACLPQSEGNLNHEYETKEVVPAPTEGVHKVALGSHDKVPASCRVNTYLAWGSSLGSGALAAPVVADFDQDGRKEILFSTASYFVESLLSHDGERAEGWPLALPDSTFMASPLVYDITGSGRMDVVAATEAGEIVFVDESGFPHYDLTLKISSVPMSKKWFEGLTGGHGEAYWDMMRRRDPQSAPARYRHRAPEKVDDQNNGNDGFHFPPADLSLTGEGMKSIELFLRANLPYSYVHGLKEQLNPLYSPTFQQMEFNAEQEVLVPPHILATPVIADLQRDGVDVLIVPVSYFYSESQQRNTKLYNLEGVPSAARFSVAGLVVFDLSQHTLLWQTELVTLDSGQGYRAYVYGSPVVADLDGDGVNEIVVADGSGHVHVLGANGDLVKPWPVRMGPLAAQPVVEDVNGDGKLEIIVLDANGSLVCFDHQAKELWMLKVHTGSEQPLDNSPTIGDIDGDGTLDVVVGTASGYLYAVNAMTGKLLKGYPILFPGPITAEVALAHLRGNGLHLIFTCKSRMYIVDGSDPKCSEVILMGESSYSTVSIDDFTGNGKLDFLVSSSSGNVFCFASEVPYHPLNTWSTPWSGGTKTSTNYGFHGIFAENRKVRDVVGSSLPLRFTIVDKRGARKDGVKPSYNVSISINGLRAFEKSYSTTGTFTAHLPVPMDRTSAAVTLWMENDAHQIFTDFFSLSFNVRFYRLLKFVLIAPLALLVGVVAWTASSMEPKKTIL